jgi:hypothetical protein
MFNSNITFLGIDPSAGQKPFAYAALDSDLRLLALGKGSLDDVLAFAAGQRQAFAAVCAPCRPNQGVMARPEIRQDLSLPARSGSWCNFRLADYLLRQRNIPIPQTPGEEEACPNWMRMGFQLHSRLERLGYLPYPQEEAPRQRLEVYPHASYAALLGVVPFPKYTLEGRLQRQLVLHERKINVGDPMNFFEEITRHRLLKGILPVDDLNTPTELDALVAAYTAHQAALQPGEVTLVGDPAEGQIAVPVSALKARY